MGAKTAPPWVGANVFGAYAIVGGLAAAVAFALGHDPTTCQGWIAAPAGSALLLSLGSGLCLGVVAIATTRAMVRRSAWARALHIALRPAVHRVGDGTLLAISVASAMGEELLFRGLLVPIAGIIGSSFLFGTLHQVRGRARWGWMLSATVMGLLLAILFKATGSLAGPVVAHLAINHANLRFLRDNDPTPRHRILGGLLNR